MARTLDGFGVKENDVISILCENRHEFTAIAFGAIYLNAIVSPINVTYTERKIIFRLNYLINCALDCFVPLQVNSGTLLIFQSQSLFSFLPALRGKPFQFAKH